jgi:uncharacterized protein (TIGR00299 family) protein
MTHRFLHLDPLGGAAGDMFAAAMLDAFPQHTDAVVAAAAAVSGVACRLAPHRGAVMVGQRFIVGAPAHVHADGHPHDHTTWRLIRARLEAAALPPGVRARAIGIFAQLAAAEARVHGVAEDAVTFHEVGAADSIADIVAAAWLIDAMGEVQWSVGSLPLGGGRVQTQHGPMPVPAPATALLLEGFACVDDGIPGERVTPTGAAILRHLGCTPRTGRAGRLVASGTGFGARALDGISNVLRVLAFETDAQAAAPAGTHRELAVIGFEVDDQSGEDLAAGLDRLRGLAGVHDVLQSPVFGKKSRMAVHVQVLAAPEALDAVIEACFAETTTIGLRTHLVQGRALPRHISEVEVDGARLRVKSVARPGGATAKAESDDALHLAGHAARARLRRRAEAMLGETDDV